MPFGCRGSGQSWPRGLADAVYGPTPFGCQCPGTGITRSMMEHMRAARAEGLSPRGIADVLNTAEIPCKRGGAPGGMRRQ